MRWFDQFLKGKDTGILNEAPIKLFVMGANVWRDEQAWPLARAIETRYYLHSGGHANSLNGDGTLSTNMPDSETPDLYVYDPAHPVITRGGALLMSPEFPSGVYDQRQIESRDVLFELRHTAARDDRQHRRVALPHPRDDDLVDVRAHLTGYRGPSLVVTHDPEAAASARDDRDFHEGMLLGGQF